MGDSCSGEHLSGIPYDILPVASAEEPAARSMDAPSDFSSNSLGTTVLDTTVNSAVDEKAAIRDTGSITHTDIGSADDDSTAFTAEAPAIAFIDACRGGYAELVQRMLRAAHVNPAANDNSALRCAAANGHARVVDILLSDTRVDPTALRYEALISAAGNGHAAVVEVLLGDVRVQPKADSYGALAAAARNGHVEVVEMFAADPRVSPSVLFQIGLWVAMERNQLGVVKLLLQDERIDATQYENFTIFYAAEEKHYEIVDALLLDYRVLVTLPGCLTELKEVLTVRPLPHILQSVRTCTWRRRMDAVRGHTFNWCENDL
jgi:hypothetical protein